MSSLPARHYMYALALVAFAHLAWIHTIDSPKLIYHCPLDLDGLLHYWNDENCYWSMSYPEARSKFVALGNQIREQLREQPVGLLDVVDIKSYSYDVSDENVIKNYDGDYAKFIASLMANSNDTLSTPQKISPEKDTVDVLLLTLREPRQEVDSDKKEFINIIHSSGVHGVEGYLGSAVQLRYLHELILGNDHKLQSSRAGDSNILDTKSSERLRKILLIHAVNPNGMRHHRRTNENNVDLNRNALSPDVWKDVRSRDPNFVGYIDLDSALNPFLPLDGTGGLFSWVAAARKAGYQGDAKQLQLRDDEVKQYAETEARLWQQSKNTDLQEFSLRDDIHSWKDEKMVLASIVQSLLNTILSVGYANGKRALVAAQYLKPSGIGYGGGAHVNHINKWENSIFAVQHAINEFAGFQLNESGNSDRVFWIDVHTGLGKYGTFKMLGFDSKKEELMQANKWSSKIAALLGGSQPGMGQTSDKEVDEGYEQTKGFVNDHLLCPPPNCFSGTQEFGTRPGVAVALALIMENRSHQMGAREYGSYTSWAFYPQRLSWRRKTLRGGINMLSKVMAL